MTGYWVTALRRTARNRLFRTMLALLFLCVLFFGSIERQVRMPKAGIVLRDNDALAVALQQSLASDGVLVFESEEKLLRAVEDTTVTAGFVVKEGLTERLQNGQIEGCTLVYHVPTSSFVQSEMMRVAVHLCDLYAPYLVERLAQQQQVKVTVEQVRAHIDQRLQSDASFAFTFTDVQGKQIDARSYSQGLIYGIFAVLLFCLFTLCCATEKDTSFRQMCARIGAVRAFDTVWLPALAVRYLLCLAAVGAAGMLCHLLYGTAVQDLWWQCAVYMLFLCGIGAAADAVLVRFSRIQTAVAVVVLPALGICPIFVDAGYFVGIPEAVKCLLPPYFFYKVMQAPLLCAVIAAAVCAAGILLRRTACKRAL